MDHPIPLSPIQQQQQYGQIRATKTSIVRLKAPSNNRTSSTSRRPLDESGSSEKQSHRQVKKSRPYEPTPSTHPSVVASSFPTLQFRFPPYHHFNIFHQKGMNNEGGVIVPVGKHLRATRVDVNIENIVTKK